MVRRILALVLLSAAVLTATASCKAPVSTDSGVLDNDRQGLDRYEAIRIQNLGATRNFASFRPEQGIFVTERHPDGTAKAGKIRVLSDNPANKIQISADFNDWGKTLTPDDELKPVAGTPYYEGRIRQLKHLMQYRLILNGKQVLDPAATLYSTPEFYAQFGIESAPYLNSVFWDFDRPGAYRMQHHSVDLRTKPLMIAEAEVFEMVKKWTRGGGVGPKAKHETYKFVAESGVISKLAEMGYNAIEFLPFNASMDGDSWHFRYQVFGLFAPDSRYGSPDDFMQMMDAFNKAGIAVIMDAVVGHYPFKGNQGPRDLNPIGQHNFKKADGKVLYGEVGSPWGTYRYDYANPYVRRFLTDSILHMVGRYGVSGIRFDNLDGIRLYEGPGGGGPEFLKLLMTELRAYRPEMILIAEMFFGHAPVMERLDHGGFGINMRTHSDFFDFLKDNMLKRTEDINMDMLRNAIRNPWGWGEAARVQYVTNHDEAANRRDGATGNYPATLLNGGGWSYVENKTKAFGALAILSSSAYLDMPQMRILQEGSFYSNPAIDWDLLKQESQARTSRFFQDLSRLFIAEPAFAFRNLHPNVENHTDYQNKVISVRRIDGPRDFYAVINLSHQSFEGYRFGVNSARNFKVVFDSNRSEYGGSGRTNGGELRADSHGSHGQAASLVIPRLDAYGVVVVKGE